MTGPLTALNLAFVNFFNFKGRATRAEFWWATLFFSIAGAIAGFVDGIMMARLMNSQDPTALYGLSPFDFSSTYCMIILTIPYSSLSVRRLHDVGLSGFWWFLSFIPLVGSIVLLVMHCLPSNNQTSIYGTPKGPTAMPSGATTGVDTHQRAMQGYAMLFDKDKPVTAETQAARKAEMADYYRSRVLKSAPSA